jgi:hypothetical protein
MVGIPNQPKRRSTDRPLTWLWLNLVPLFALTIAAWAVIENSNKVDRAELLAIRAETRSIARIEAVERQDRNTARASAYRICARAMVDRAFAHARIRSAGGTPALRKLQRKDGLAILDCTPNLDGLPAKAYTPAQQARFVRRWERGKLTPAELGICKQPIGTTLTRRKAC